MSDFNAIENDFLDSLTDIIKENISSEKFGVSELAHEIGMSRSNLLRKVKTLTRISVSQFIRQVRLKQAMEMLRQTSFTVSEVSYKVGFGSTSYFIKCFHDYYGYPPGEVGNRVENIDDYVQSGLSGKKKFIVFLGLTLGIIIILAVLYIIFKPVSLRNRALDKSIAVLPFRNESNDSSNVYIINGLMESILTDLQQINDLRVVSRTSVEKYRNTNKQIPEIAKELNVNYFIEGSGQKIGDQILLNIQLIEGPDDKHLWARQYRRRTDDIFDLQIELAGDIAKGVEAIITPEEEARIKKPPTGNLVAYDYFLKGLDLFDKGTRQDLEKAIPFFEKAIEHDNNFARAYADLAITYYFLDAFQTEKKYSMEIGNYADKALSIDDQLAQSLIAKALFFINTGQNKKAVPYLEKALEYNPNSALVINILSDFYARYSPDTGKYLEYALKGIRLDIAANDSNTVSRLY
jgi:TolB-like protein/AraC-like DNA-binding protein